MAIIRAPVAYDIIDVATENSIFGSIGIENAVVQRPTDDSRATSDSHYRTTILTRRQFWPRRKEAHDVSQRRPVQLSHFFG